MLNSKAFFRKMLTAFLAASALLLLVRCGEGFRAEEDELFQYDSIYDEEGFDQFVNNFGEEDGPRVVQDDVAPGSGLVPNVRPMPRPSGLGGSPSPAPSPTFFSFMPEDMQVLDLNRHARWAVPDAIVTARQRIQSVGLAPANIEACDFDPLIGSNATGNSCFERIVLSSQFRNFISTNGSRCALEAGREAFGRTPSQVLFHSNSGGSVFRYWNGTSVRSLHHVGQALDIHAISLFFSNRNRERVPMTDSIIGADHTFYWAFTRCWRQAAMGFTSCPAGENTGAITHMNDPRGNHDDHIHLSIPFCERERFNVRGI
jgi:hypothetical protein